MCRHHSAAQACANAGAALLTTSTVIAWLAHPAHAMVHTHALAPTHVPEWMQTLEERRIKLLADLQRAQ